MKAHGATIVAEDQASRAARRMFSPMANAGIANSEATLDQVLPEILHGASGSWRKHNAESTSSVANPI